MNAISNPPTPAAFRERRTVFLSGTGGPGIPGAEVWRAGGILVVP
jgi:hypothetical protein